jgi:membrane-bound metal-dependent hydrolase YbcI (DUF457 family)
MAVQQSHMSFSLLLAVLYALFGLLFLAIDPERVLLASIIVVLAGMLPDIDGGVEAPARELGGLLAAVLPLLLLEYFPSVKAGGVARIALIVVCGYLLTRISVVRVLQKFTAHRGMIHSLPAAIITAELTYLLFFDLRMIDKVYISMAAFAGFFAHLLLDAYTNLDLIGRAMGQQKKQPSALKLFGSSARTAFVMYTCMIFLGWLVAKDIYPYLHLQTKVVY